MDGYKVDQLKKGEEIAKRYLPNLFESNMQNTNQNTARRSSGYMSGESSVPSSSSGIPEYKRSSSQYKNDQLENGRRMFEKYMVPRLEQESRKRENRLPPGGNLIDEYIEWEKQKARREKIFPQIPTAERIERLNMIGQYQKDHPVGKQTLSAGDGIMVEKDGQNLYITPQEDPEYDKYRKKGEENILFGLSDSGWRATAQSMARFAFDKAGLQALEDMTDEETELYNYILGKYGSAAAGSYVDSFREDLNKRWMDREKEETREFAKEHPVLGTAVNVAAPVVSYEPYIAAMAAELTGQDLDINSPVFAPVTGEQATREGLKDAVGRGPVKDFLVDTGLSMGQSLARLPLGAGAAGLSAGLSSASSGYLDARERGGTTGQALLSGAAQGAAEGAGEAFSLGRLERFMQAPGKGVKNFAKNVAKQAVVEGSEEGVTELMNTLSDQLIMGDKSNYSAAYQHYKAEGESDVKARFSAAADMAQNILLSAAGGAISGGVMGAGTQAAGFGLERAYNRQKQTEALAEATKNAAETGGTLKPGESRSVGRRGEGEITKSAENGGAVSESGSGKTGLEQAADRLAAKAQEEAAEDFSDLGRYGKRAAQKFYDPALDPSEYQRAFNRYYDTAKYQLDPQYPAQAAYTSVLTEKQARAALAAGTLDRERELSTTPKYIQGQAKTGGVVNRSSSATKGQIGVSEALGKKTGLTFVLEEDLGDSEGAYDSGQIRISTDSKNFLQTTSHELTHFMKDYAPQEYSVYRDLAIQALAESQSEDLEAMVERYARAYEGQNLSREQIIEEIAADATGEFLNDEAFIEKVVNKDRTIAQKVIDFLSDMIDAIKSVMRRENTRRAAKALKEQADFYEDAREFWMKGLEKAGETYKSGLETESEARYQKKTEETEKGYYLDGENVVITDPSKIKQKQWQGMLKGFKAAGFTNYKNVQQLKDSVKTMVEILGNYDFSDERNDIAYEILFGGEEPKEELSSGKMYKNALKTLGATRYIEAAGYLTVDGKFLDFSGKQDGGNPKHRGMDHRDIQDIYEENGRELESGTDAMIEFIKEGNIRLIPESGGIDLIHKPNEKQKSGLRTFIGRFDGEIKIDFSNEKGDVVESFEYPKRTSASKILADIDNYIDRGEKPYISDLGQFRYQLKNVDDDIDYKSLLKENKELADINRELARQLTLTKDYMPRKEDIKKVARQMIEEYQSEYPLETLEENLSRLYGYIHNSYQADWEEVTDAAVSIARSVLNQSKVKNTELADHYRDVLKTVRTTKISLPRENRAEFEIEGGYNAFRKKYFGKIRLTDQGTAVDTVYQELSGKYPELFPDEIANPSDQLLRIAEVVDSLRPQIDNPYKADIDELSAILGQEIFKQYRSVRALPPTKMDRMKAEMDRLRWEYDRKMDAFKARIKKRYDEQSGDLISRHKAELKARDERLERAKVKRQIIKDVTELKRWLLEPNDKKHVPEELRVPLAEFLSRIDFSSKRLNAEGEETKRTQAWQEAQKAFREIMDRGNLDQDGNYLELDPDLAARMEELKHVVAEIDKLENLGRYEMEQVSNAVEAIKKLITEMNALHAFEAYQNVSVLAKKTLKGLNGRKKRKEYQGARGAVQRLFRESMLNPLTFFYQMGNEGNSIFQGLREGRDKETRNLAQAEKAFKKLLEENQVTPAQMREWSGDKAKLYEINLVTDKIYMTKAEIMSLYELNKRRQAQGHMYDEEGNASRARGFRLPDRKIKTKTGTYLQRNVSHVSVSRKMVKEITALLTPQEKAVADGIARFFQTVTTDWGNEISMKLYGYKKYTAKDYFPISVDRNQIALTTDALGRAQTIKNMGFTKSTVKGANKPIDVEDIFDVFADRTAKMAIYNAYMPSLSDLQKWYNFNDPEVGNMKAALEQTFGRGSLDYIKNLMLDINGGGNAETGAVKYLTRAVKSAAVGANLRTAIQQPTAYIRAAMEIEPRYLIEGLKAEEPWEEIKRHVPIAQWKDWGFFDVHTGRSMKSILIGSNSLQELLTEKSMLLASKMDEWTWTRLWAAAKAETRALRPELEPGSEAFYNQTAARMTEIIDKTQVVDSVLNRSQIMREKTLFKQMVTSFMAEPTQSYNMLYRAYYDMEQKPTKENRKKLAKAVFVFTQTGVATALAAAFIDALRDEEDEDYWKRYMGAVGENLADNLNPMNMVPFLRDVWSIMSGYDVKRMDMQAVEEAYNLAKEIGKAVSGESKLNVFGVMNKSLKLGSTVLGVPVYNLKRDIGAIVNQGLKLTGSGISLKNVGLDEGNEKNAGVFMADAVSEYMKGNKAAGDRIVKKLKAAGIENKKIDQAIKGSLRKTEAIIEAAEAKLAGDYKTYERIAKEVQEAGFTKEQVVSAVNSAIYKIKKEKEEETEEEKEEEAEAGEETAYLYTGSDIVDAMESGDYRAANEMADRVFKEKTRMHVKESKIKSSIKSSVTRAYKEEYLKGNVRERQEIKRKLKRLRVNGKALYENEDFENWEEAKEKEEKGY